MHGALAVTLHIRGCMVVYFCALMTHNSASTVSIIMNDVYLIAPSANTVSAYEIQFSSPELYMIFKYNGRIGLYSLVLAGLHRRHV